MSKQYNAITKTQAKKQKAKWYFTGKSCPNGHVCPRFTCNSKCVLCVAIVFNNLKTASRQLTASAITCGRLVRMPCEVCGDKAEAHHEDYGKPFDITWLCDSHHHQRHKELRRA